MVVCIDFDSYVHCDSGKGYLEVDGDDCDDRSLSSSKEVFLRNRFHSFSQTFFYFMSNRAQEEVAEGI